jgi:hypothetical protein
MAFSPFRHALSNENGFVSAFEARENSEFYTIRSRDARIQVGQPLVFESFEYSQLNDLAAHSEFPEIGAEVFPPCLLQLGLLTSMRTISKDLEVQKIPTSEVFTADTFGSFWMFAGSEPPVAAAPWYYGGLSGFDAASYVLVPKCAVTPRAVKSVAREFAEQEIKLREVRNTELYVLFEKLN